MSEPVYPRSSIERLAAASAAISAMAKPIDAGRPWPAPLVAGEGPEAEWGPPEVLGHLTEMLPYWLGEIERVLAGTPEPVPFGRVSTDPLRIMTIDRDRSLPTRELIGRLQSSVERYARRLPELSAADWARNGLHPRLGEMTISAMLERFAVSHLEEHVVQLNASLAGLNEPAAPP